MEEIRLQLKLLRSRGACDHALLAALLALCRGVSEHASTFYMTNATA